MFDSTSANGAFQNKVFFFEQKQEYFEKLECLFQVLRAKEKLPDSLFKQVFVYNLFHSPPNLNNLFFFHKFNAFLILLIHRLPAKGYVTFQEIWNEFRGSKKHSDFLMNYNLRKRSINNKLFIHSVKIHKDFFKLIYHSYGL